jgi:hypothetical protein
MRLSTNYPRVKGIQFLAGLHKVRPAYRMVNAGWAGVFNRVPTRGVTIYRYTSVSQYAWLWFDNWYDNAENRFLRYGFKIQIHIK